MAILAREVFIDLCDIPQATNVDFDYCSVHDGTPQKVQERINWQRPKAIICGVLLIVFTVVNVRLWSYLIKKSRVSGSKRTPKDRALVVAGSVTFVCCLLLVIMAAANVQGAIGPIAISLLGIGS